MRVSFEGTDHVITYAGPGHYHEKAITLGEAVAVRVQLPFGHVLEVKDQDGSYDIIIHYADGESIAIESIIGRVGDADPDLLTPNPNDYPVKPEMTLLPSFRQDELDRRDEDSDPH
jgi:hypothetical protein